MCRYPVYLSIYLSIYLPTYLPIYLSIYLTIYLYAYIYAHFLSYGCVGRFDFIGWRASGFHLGRFLQEGTREPPFRNPCSKDENQIPKPGSI